MAADAMTPAASDNHQIAQGLLEISRVFLNHILEEDVRLVWNPDLLQCALGFNIVAAWSGDKWQIGLYQKAMYIEMIRRSRSSNTVHRTQRCRLQTSRKFGKHGKNKNLTTARHTRGSFSTKKCVSSKTPPQLCLLQ
ncbi:hypothetical protein KCU77_g18048, partial [Aureobasidium melanogenum]